MSSPPSKPLTSASSSPSKQSTKSTKHSPISFNRHKPSLPRIWPKRSKPLFTPNPIGSSLNARAKKPNRRTLLTMGQTRERLPTLFEVLNRMSAPPVDLWTFYEFMRTNYRGVEYLDFWLDAANHVKLCKQYVEGHEFDSSETKLDQFAPQDYAQPPEAARGPSPRAHTSNQSSFGRASYNSIPSPSSSVLLNMLGDGSQQSRQLDEHGFSNHGRNRASLGTNSIDTSGSGRRRDTIARLSALLDEFQTKNGEFAPLPSEEEELELNEEFDAFFKTKRPQPPRRQHDIPYENDEDFGEAEIGMARAPVLGAPYERVPGGSPTQRLSPKLSPRLPAHRNTPSADQIQFGGPLHSISEPVLLSHHANDSAYINPPIVGLEDIYASVNSIVLRYLTPGAEREILLPGQMARQIRDAAQGAGRRDPSLFNEARDYVFEVMEREAYPAFLASAALRNIRPASSLFRLMFGMVALFGAFWLSFVFILLNWSPKSHRLWIILPFGIGWYLVLSSLYNLDFVLGFLGYCEKEGGGIAPVKEEYVSKLIRERSALVASLTVVVSACFVVLFVLVPGHRL